MFGGFSPFEPPRVRAVELQLHVPLKDLYTGVTKKVQVPVRVCCSSCEGYGCSRTHTHTHNLHLYAMLICPPASVVCHCISVGFKGAPQVCSSCRGRAMRLYDIPALLLAPVKRITAVVVSFLSHTQTPVPFDLGLLFKQNSLWPTNMPNLRWRRPRIQ
jgi:hypothetical protein